MKFKDEFTNIFNKTSKQEEKLSKKDLKKLKLFESIPSENQNGDCYEQALNYFNLNDCTLVHGLVDGQGPLEGITYNHAWCENNGTIIDMTLAPEVQKALPVDLYYSIGNIKTTYKYDRQSANEKMVEYGTYGPWENKLIKNRY